MTDRLASVDINFVMLQRIVRECYNQPEQSGKVLVLLSFQKPTVKKTGHKLLRLKTPPISIEKEERNFLSAPSFTSLERSHRLCLLLPSAETLQLLSERDAILALIPGPVFVV